MAFYNISNHPCHAEKTTWSAKQIAAAEELGGEVVDIGFPKITPDMSDEELARVCHAVALDIKGMAMKDEKSAAMVAGEYCATIMIIAELESAGIKCVFGQTERKVEERIEDGKLVVIHNWDFAGFRKAPLYKLV